MNRPRILLAGFWPEQVDGLKAKFPEAEFEPTDGAGAGLEAADALVSLTQDALDALFVPEILEKYRRLRWVHASSAGVDDYLPHLASAPFTFTSGKIICGPQVADHGMALLLALARRLPWVIRRGSHKDAPRPTELHGKRALVVGLGGVGMGLAERCRAFGMRVSGVSETSVPIMSFLDSVYTPDRLMEALGEADVVLIASALTPRTRRLINRAAIAGMKEDAYLINVARGPIVDTEALTEAVGAGRFAGVGLDVTDPEPLPEDHPLRGCDRVLITPHYAGTTASHARRFELIEANIRLFLAGRPLLNVVDKALGY